MRAELLDPGGCSACPISLWAIWTMRDPASPPPTGASAAAPLVGGLPMAPVRASRKAEEEAGAAVGAACCGGEKAVLISAIRESTASRDIAWVVVTAGCRFSQCSLATDHYEKGRPLGRPSPLRTS